jgi:lysophospholipase L1-like esterase
LTTTHPADNRAPLRHIGVAALTVVTACGLLLLGEVLFRALGPKPSRAMLADTTYFRPAEYVMSSHPPNLVQRVSDASVLWPFEGDDDCVAVGGERIRFNSLGYRSAEFSALPPKAAGEVRIVVTGGSAAISWLVDEACTLHARLERELGARLPGARVRVFNLGSGTWKSLQELIAVQVHGLAIDPDVVIAFDGFNDIQHAFDMPINRAYLTGVVEVAFEQYRQALRWSVSDFAGSFASVRYVRERLTTRPTEIGAGADRQPESQPPLAAAPAPGRLATRLERVPIDLEAVSRRTDFDPHNRAAVDAYLTNLRLLARALTTTGARLLVVLQPTLYLKDPLSPAETDILWRQYHHAVNFVAQGYARMIPGLERLARDEPNVLFLDASRAFAGEPSDVFRDYVHMKPEGYRRLSRQISESLAARLREGTEP